MKGDWPIRKGSVWRGVVMTPARVALIQRYRASCQWLLTARPWTMDAGRKDFAPQWTSKQRADFRKWRSDFMRPFR